jgi:hypothetical protein
MWPVGSNFPRIDSEEPTRASSSYYKVMNILDFEAFDAGSLEYRGVGLIYGTTFGTTRTTVRVERFGHY